MKFYVAFLRAINVGGKRRVPMRELVSLFESLGCKSPRAYLQSGNVVFQSSLAERTLETKLEEAIAAKFGFEVPVTLRTASEMEKVVTESPHAKRYPQERLHVAFLKHKPAAGVELLSPKAATEDRLHLAGRELYLYLPGGVGESKLTNVFLDKQLATTCTLRNWNTVLAVTEMLRGM